MSRLPSTYRYSKSIARSVTLSNLEWPEKGHVTGINRMCKVSERHSVASENGRSGTTVEIQYSTSLSSVRLAAPRPLPTFRSPQPIRPPACTIPSLFVIYQPQLLSLCISGVDCAYHSLFTTATPKASRFISPVSFRTKQLKGKQMVWPCRRSPVPLTIRGAGF
jgi:hypothetical protein